MPKPKPPGSEHLFHVSPAVGGQTLAAALRQWLPDQTWSQVRQRIQSRHLTINGNVCVDPGRRLKPGDAVKLLATAAAPPPAEHDVKVHYLDAHLIVVEKPSGMTSNRHREERRWPARRRQILPTLDELLPQIIAKIEGRRGHRGVPPPVRAVHRLDRDTSGLMVFARTHAAERILAQQFRQHTTHRRYLAIVEGEVSAQTIRSRLVRDRGDGRRGRTDDPNLGKEAITHVKPMETTLNNTLIQCRLETGRTHQIRIHLSEQGHPVCGEKIYRSGSPAASRNRPRRDIKAAPDAAAPRLALHAAELGFVHPLSGSTLRFQAPLPSELAEFWRTLKKQYR